MTNKAEILQSMKSGRRLAPAQARSEALGPLGLLAGGEWRSLPGRGWNMIALPFSGGDFSYRLLMNQYNEVLRFKLADEGVANRGLATGSDPSDGDQFVAALDYEQTITQIDAEDSPNSGLAGGNGVPIHHEPGLFLHILNHATNGLDIARLATIPHGDSVLALGDWETIDGAPQIPQISGLPIGVNGDLDTNPYLAPYKHFTDPIFNDLFDPRSPNDLLGKANEGLDIVRTTRLTFDTTLETGGIVNIPFVVDQANAVEMKSTFWIEELSDTDAAGNPKLRLQYSQIVMLDFFDRSDGEPGLIRWPHISINTLEKFDN